ncbi:calcium uptake protein, mitochondrial-like isoform X1 [Phragmites australis]|uniref:calcium uptake protein, mitochondrial-like isoform X1 n=1 Tax=Phragmites australis TaxID=29695 RepID=UPI002D76C049|nr:calcium uptake protein, mitochondrial-like isoform X1 [Phragmites australis]
MAAGFSRASRLLSAIGLLGPPRARASSSSSTAAEAPRREASAFAVAAAVAAGSGLGIWMLPSTPQPLADSGQVADDAAAAAAGGGIFASFGCAGAAGELEERRRFLFGDSYRRRVFFNYEKRIRTRSPPEKIFEYFASVHNPEGEVYMLPTDLMRAVVPVFPPSESKIVREGRLRGERHTGELHCAPSEFFMLFDTNGDGLISFAEYIFFVTLLSIPESSFNVAFKMFDLDHNGEIDKDEFRKVMTLMRSYNRQGAAHRDGLRFGRKVGQPVENGGLVEYFFGKDGNEHLHYDKFSKFLKQLHDEQIVRLEFSHYDVKSSNTIPVKDFALSMVASADMNHINKLLDRVDDLDDNPDLKDLRITFEVCGVDLTDKVVDIIFHVFDANRDGNLSSEEFLRSLQRRENDIRQPATSGFLGVVSCWLNCTKCSLQQMLF